MAYSKKMYRAVSEADRHLPGVKLACVCIDAQIPVQVVAKWLGVTRQGIYYWFTGKTGVDEKHFQKIAKIVRVLTAAVDDFKLPAKDLATALAVVKTYRETIK